MRGVFVFMAIYSIIITSSPDSGDALARALRFIDGVYDNGDEISNVFFFHQGVLHANRFFVPMGNSINAVESWNTVKTKYAIPLIVCTTAANKRGLLDDEEAKSLGEAQSHIAPPFNQSGLGEFFTLLHDCDRVVQF